MKTYSAIIEKCKETDLFVGYIPGFPGAHSQAENIEELRKNLIEVISMLLEDGEPELENLFFIHPMTRKSSDEIFHTSPICITIFQYSTQQY